ncbi:lipoprotein [Streptomyces prasinosporus]|uniref:Lipoprotein n=1 Tax=Streptomyces prasinosporus TaxID=68256 RepID=A0ABP6TL25_9ACTN
MNRRPTLLAALALTATAALTLSACGSDDDSAAKDSDKITGADTGGEKSASPTASAPASADRPKIELPADLKLTFEDAETGDPAKDEVLADSAERMRAVDAAITGTDPKGEAIAYYNTGKALEAALNWVAQFKKAGATLTGEARYYDREVTLKSETSAVLTFCADESKGFGKDKKTNEVHKTPVTKNSYVLYNTRLDKNAEGVWQTSQIVSTRGATQCRP